MYDIDIIIFLVSSTFIRIVLLGNLTGEYVDVDNYQHANFLKFSMLMRCFQSTYVVLLCSICAIDQSHRAID